MHNGNGVYEILGAEPKQALAKTLPTATPQPLEAKITKLKVYEKDGKLCGVCIAQAPTGAKFIVMTCLPLPDSLALEGEEVGWGFGDAWEAVKDAGKAIGKGGEYTGKGLMKVVQSPQFQSLAMQAAPIAMSAFGVPPQISTQAMQLVNRAKGGDPGALDKVRNISEMANQGYPPAEQLYGLMSSYFRGGIPAVQQLPPMPQQPGPFGPQWQQWQQYQQQLAYGQPYRVPAPGWGQGYVSGWLWNVPYRSNLAAASLDPTNPFNAVRKVYYGGMED